MQSKNVQDTRCNTAEFPRKKLVQFRFPVIPSILSLTAPSSGISTATYERFIQRLKRQGEFSEFSVEKKNT